MTHSQKIGFLLALTQIIFFLSSCKSLKGTSLVPQYETDLVCGMKVGKSEAYTYKYENKKYFFDSYNCKQTFKMNPKKYLENKCAPKTP